MKRIRTLKTAPPGLSRYRSQQGASARWREFREFEEGAARVELIETLTQLQHGLCGYCEIDLTPTDRLIEHFVPRSDSLRGAQLEFSPKNTLASCQGGSSHTRDGGHRHVDRTCDQAKGAHWSPDLLDPRRIPDQPALMLVEPDGTIVPDPRACRRVGVTPERVSGTIEVLNLNAPRLKEIRKEVWDEMDQLWSRVADPGQLRQVMRFLLLPRKDGRLRPWFSTMRSFFGESAELVLSRESPRWI